MRKYITEKVGILECFQIVITVVIIALLAKGFFTDSEWNNMVETQGINVCVDINKNISLVPNGSDILRRSECEDDKHLNLKGQACTDHLQKYYLTRTDEAFKARWQNRGGIHSINKVIEKYLKRRQAGELSIIVVVLVVLILLLAHVITASLSKNIELRTKWNAALQGVILFICSYSAVILAITVNNIELNYDNAANKFEACRMLRFCDRNRQSDPILDHETDRIIADELTEHFACQEIDIKSAIIILLIILIVMCAVMTGLSMALTMKYEQESDEDHEALDNELLEQEYFNNLLDDQPLEFEVPQRDSTDTPNIDIPLLSIRGNTSGEDLAVQAHF